MNCNGMKRLAYRQTAIQTGGKQKSVVWKLWWREKVLELWGTWKTERERKRDVTCDVKVKRRTWKLRWNVRSVTKFQKWRCDVMSMQTNKQTNKDQDVTQKKKIRTTKQTIKKKKVILSWHFQSLIEYEAPNPYLSNTWSFETKRSLRNETEHTVKRT